MRVLRSTVAVGLLTAFVAACSGAPGATQSPAGGGGGGATLPSAEPPAPVETPSGGGGGGGGGNTGGGSGQMHIEVSGPVQASGDYPFFAFGSRFGGEAGVQLNFTSEGSDAIASITGVQGAYVIGYASDVFVASAQTCELTNWNIGGTSGSGSFDCTGGFATTTDGTYVTGVNIKGSFEASQ